MTHRGRKPSTPANPDGNAAVHHRGVAQLYGEAGGRFPPTAQPPHTTAIAVCRHGP